MLYGTVYNNKSFEVIHKLLPHNRTIIIIVDILDSSTFQEEQNTFFNAFLILVTTFSIHKPFDLT